MTPREFAIEVTEKLQSAGYEALWAGGCVRDQMLGIEPKDYDVATIALPEQVRELFGKRRTLPIGASFGVITVLGPKSAGQIEVATFRRDGGYTDGRRPDAVEFTDAKEDALRRDFTINGMFYDPIAEEVHDFVGGVEDLQSRLIRAIGNPESRIDEDKLRMLRAIRFASTYDFKIESATMEAIRQHAPEIQVVSGERIGTEMRKVLTHPNRAIGMQLLRQSNLLDQIFPQGPGLYHDQQQWERMLVALKQLPTKNFCCALSLVLRLDPVSNPVAKLFHQWKLSNEEKKSIQWILAKMSDLAAAHQQPWSVIQPLLIKPDAERCVTVVEQWHRAAHPGESTEGTEFCRERLAWPSEQLDPPPLLDGNSLKQMNLEAGKIFGEILKTVRAEQLDGILTSVDDAEARAREIAGV